jgi:D-amino-acid dehydrogenase
MWGLTPNQKCNYSVHSPTVVSVKLKIAAITPSLRQLFEGPLFMHAVVLGAGIMGATSAWYLLEAGHEVTVIERQPAAALETSFANGGQRSVGHVEPWASWATLPQAVLWSLREDAPLLFRLRADPAQWRWGLQFLRECSAARYQHNLQQLLHLGLYSRGAMSELQSKTGIQNHSLERGTLNIYNTPAAWARGCAAAEKISALGYPRFKTDVNAALALEPAMHASSKHWVGATYTPGDGSGDAHLFIDRLAKQCVARGARFLYNRSVQRLVASGGVLRSVVTDGESITADAVVVACGSFSTALLQPLGIRLPIYPVKGYSATVPIRNEKAVPTVSITDDAHKLVFTRLGDTFRVAGTAEFNGYDVSLNTRRCQALIARAQTLFPEAAHYDQPTFWAGLRPATPSNCPLIGRTRIPNLYLNTGHGTLGWTLGAGSGKALAEILGGATPAVDFNFLGL